MEDKKKKPLHCWFMMWKQHRKLLPFPEKSFLHRGTLQLPFYVGLSVMDKGGDGSQWGPSLHHAAVTVVYSCEGRTKSQYLSTPLSTWWNTLIIITCSRIIKLFLPDLYLVKRQNMRNSFAEYDCKKSWYKDKNGHFDETSTEVAHLMWKMQRFIIYFNCDVVL